MSSNLSEAALITLAKDTFVETFENLSTFQDVAQKYNPNAGSMQRSGNSYFKTLQQHARRQNGWDMTGKEDGVLELSVGGGLGDPENVVRKLRADDLRDETSWRNAMQADAMELLSGIEQDGLEKAARHGSLCVTDSAAFGSGQSLWNGLADAETRMFETSIFKGRGTCAFLNGTAHQAGGYELAQAATNFGTSISDDAYKNGMLQRQIAGINDVRKHNMLPRFEAQAASLAVDGDQSFEPLATEVAPSGSEVPFDSRYATLPVTGTATGVVTGDKFKIAGVKAVNLDTKQVQDYDQTFTVVAVNGQNLTISPRPIAVDDTNLNDLQKAYSNINTTISDSDALVWLNTTSRKSNIVMAKDAMVLASQPIPFNHELFSNFQSESFQVGAVNGIIGYQGDLLTGEGVWRSAIWYDWQVERPEAVGVILDGQA